MQAKQITDIKQFVALVNDKSTQWVKVKKGGKEGVKFKARAPGKLVTLVVPDQEKAEKLMKMFPPHLKPQMI